LLAGIGHRFLQFANALPRVFTEIANAGVEGRAAPGFNRPESDLIELAGNRQHVFQAYTGGKNGLVGITQHHIGNAERLFC
jgi:hypothetical protein